MKQAAKKLPVSDMEAGQPLVPSRQADTDPLQKKHQHTKHSWLHVLLHPHSRHPHAIRYQTFISNLILADVLFFVASTDPRWKSAHPHLFYYEEGLVSGIFLLEYLCRIYVAPEAHKYHNTNPWKARWDYMTTLPALVDAMAALPFFLELPTGLSLPNLTWLRFFRLLRILKTKSYVQSMETVWRVIYYNREILTVALNMCCLLVLTTSVLMYYLRPRHAEDDDDDDDNGDFSSLLSTMYLSAMMLTGQGQPEGDLPWYTKGVVLLTGIFSVAMFAIPASMLTWGFEAEAERRAKRARQKYVASLQIEESDNEEEDCDDSVSEFSYGNFISSSSSDGDTTDEEYLAIIAGGAEEEGGGDENGGGDGSTGTQQDEVVKQLIRTFQTSDVDASGALSMDEFIELMTDPSNVSQHMTMVGMATSLGFLAKRVQTLEHQLDESHNKLDDILKAVKK